MKSSAVQLIVTASLIEQNRKLIYFKRIICIIIFEYKFLLVRCWVEVSKLGNSPDGGPIWRLHEPSMTIDMVHGHHDQKQSDEFQHFEEVKVGMQVFAIEE